jgi:hypothetical protein
MALPNAYRSALTEPRRALAKAMSVGCARAMGTAKAMGWLGEGDGGGANTGEERVDAVELAELRAAVAAHSGKMRMS